MASNPQRIDLHHHVVVPELAALLKERGIDWTGGTGLPPWSRELSLEHMARLGISAAVASFHPHTYWPAIGDTERLTRSGNEYLARFVHDDPQHFGGLASLPLPDANAALRELEYAFDVLKLDGVAMLTSQGGQYPGDPDLDELFQELNRRSAIVVFHPNTDPPGSAGLKLSLPASLVEFVFDTTRCIANLLYSGTLERYPSIRYVVPHAGGTIPFLAPRIEMGEKYSPALRAQVPQGALTYLRRLYYDTAVTKSDATFAALRQFVPATQIVFGSDVPHVRGPVLDAFVSALDSSPAFTQSDRASINRENALQLFPRFATVAA